VIGNANGQDRIAVVGVDGTHRRALTRFGDRHSFNPKWMPDGRRIVFETGVVHRRKLGTTRSDIAIMNADGGGMTPLLATAAWETNPVPSPDGTRIVFTSDRDRRGPDRLGPGFEIYTAKIDGTDIARLTSNGVPDLFPDWQRLP
jgi:Tol biopolymer transport system component